MANVQVDANANLDQGNRAVVRSGNDFVYVFVNDAGTIRAYKGNVAGEPVSFAEQDGGGGNQPSNAAFQNVAVAIKSNGIVSVMWYDNDSAAHGASPAVMHAEFSTESAAANQDTWSLAPEDIAVLTNADASFAVKENPAIAIDGNDDEHVSWSDVVADMGTDKTTLFYSNKISGSWKARVQYRQLIGIVDSDIDIMIGQPTAAIGADRPIIISTRPGSTGHMKASHGDALDATAFTNFNSSIDPNIPASVDEKIHSAAIDSAGKITVAYVENVTLDLMIKEHLAANPWGTWEAVVTIDSARDYSSPTIAIDGTNRYIFAESSADNDIRLWKDEGAGFVEETADADLPNVGTFNDVKAKWANKNNNSPKALDYVFEDSAGAVQYNTFMAVATTQKTFLLDGILKALAQQKTFFLDGILQKLAQQKTFLLDALLQKVQQKTFGLDGILQKVQEKTFLLNAILKALAQQKTFLLDARLVVVRTKTFLFDGMLKAIQQKTFALNAILKAVQQKTFTLDAVLVIPPTPPIKTDILAVVFVRGTNAIRTELGTDAVNSIKATDAVSPIKGTDAKLATGFQ